MNDDPAGLRTWYVVKGHNGDLVAIMRPDLDAFIVDGPFGSRHRAVAFIQARARERRLSCWFITVAAILGVAAVAWGLWV